MYVWLNNAIPPTIFCRKEFEIREIICFPFHHSEIQKDKRTPLTLEMHNTHTGSSSRKVSQSLFIVFIASVHFEWMVYLGLVSHCPTLKRNPNNNLMTHARPLAIVQYTYWIDRVRKKEDPPGPGAAMETGLRLQSFRDLFGRHRLTRELCVGGFAKMYLKRVLPEERICK